MASRFFFAWVAPTETTFGIEHQVEDEKIVDLSLGHNEGAFATLVVTVRNPRVGLLAAGRDQWAWLSWYDTENPTGGAVPIAFCRVVGVPESPQANSVKLSFLARPADYDARKRALAETMKVAPFWDPLFLTPESRDDPDTVLETYIHAWHIDRVDHAVSASHMLNGEDGLLDFGSDFIKGTLDIQIGQPPLRQVKVSGTINWDQVATGSVDFSKQLVDAFKAIGSADKYAVKSLTGQGFMKKFPVEGGRIGGGWTWGVCSITRTDGVVVPEDYHQVIMTNGTGQFWVWTMTPVLVADYDVTRKRTETVEFTLEADCQALLTDPGDEESQEIKVNGDADEACDPADTDNPDGAMPIGDVRKRSYLTTTRGRQSIDYLICLARGAILVRSRAVTVTFSVPFRAGLDLSCRKNARIVDPHIPGGEATGKIIGYALNVQNGALVASITIGCTIGKGNTVTTVPGEPVYAEEGILETGIQAYSGRTVMPVAGEVTLSEDYLLIPPNDDGVNFFDMRAADLVEDITVFNGIAEQRTVLNAFMADLSAAIEALNQVPTIVDGDFKKLTLSRDDPPFITDYPLTVSAQMVPKTLDLEAA
ncbi:hypothetical protein [Mesorhizobium ciceri]|uniref:hypothetical protein n=1 Tax=Mesorhizobium TaxID=68287 RepID=UPI00047B7111|nr:hypothetical protein [Mesorhizobium ciceri]